jgi:hypothetical protein
MPISPGDIQSMKKGKNRARRKRKHGLGTDRRTYSFSVVRGGALDITLAALDHRSEFIRRSIVDRSAMISRLIDMREEIDWLRIDRDLDRDLRLELEHACGIHQREPSASCSACSAEQTHQGGVR